MELVKCDICGVVFEEKAGNVDLQDYYFKRYDVHGDLCDKCLKTIYSLILNARRLEKKVGKDK